MQWGIGERDLACATPDIIASKLYIENNAIELLNKKLCVIFVG